MATFPTGVSARPRGDIMGEVIELDTSRFRFVARDVLRPFRVPEAYGVIPFEPKAYGTTIPNMRRNADGSYTVSEGEKSYKSYQTEEFGHERKLDIRKKNLYRSWFDFENAEARKLYAMLRMREEKDLFDYLFSSANFALSGNTGVTVGVSWATAASAVPQTDVGSALALKKTQTGFQFNTLILTWKAWLEVSRTAHFKDLVKYTRGDAVNMLAIQELLAAYFGVERVLVADAPYNTAAKGQTASMSNIADTDYIGMAQCATGDSIDEACLGRTFHWDGDDAGLELIETYSEDKRRSDWIRVRQEIDQNYLLTDMFYLIKIHP